MVLTNITWILHWIIDVVSWQIRLFLQFLVISGADSSPKAFAAPWNTTVLRLDLRKTSCSSHCSVHEGVLRHVHEQLLTTDRHLMKSHPWILYVIIKQLLGFGLLHCVRCVYLLQILDILKVMRCIITVFKRGRNVIITDWSLRGLSNGLILCVSKQCLPTFIRHHPLHLVDGERPNRR